LRRWRIDLAIPLFAIALSMGLAYGRKPGSVIEFEDTHVVHEGGVLYPERYTFNRTDYRGGWVLEAGQSVRFTARRGAYKLDFITGLGAMIEIDNQLIQVQPQDRYQSVRLKLDVEQVTLRCVSGAINLDRMERVHE
jgi:hypothetical protein